MSTQITIQKSQFYTNTQNTYFHDIDQKDQIIEQLKENIKKQGDVIDVQNRTYKLLKKEFDLLQDNYTTLPQIYLKNIKQETGTTNDLSPTVTTPQELSTPLSRNPQKARDPQKAPLFSAAHFNSIPRDPYTLPLFSKAHFNSLKSAETKLSAHNHSSSSSSQRTILRFSKEQIETYNNKKREREEDSLEINRNVVPKLKSGDHPAGKQIQNEET